MTKVLEAVYQDGVLRPTAPLDLPDGTLVDLFVVRSAKQSLSAGRLRPDEILEAIASLPVEDGPEFCARDHDRILYGADR